MDEGDRKRQRSSHDFISLKNPSREKWGKEMIEETKTNKEMEQTCEMKEK